MARNLYILAGTLLFFALASFGMILIPGHLQPGLPQNDPLWRTTGLALLLAALISALVGVLTALFEQVDRRTEERRLHARRRRSQRRDRLQ